MVLVRRGGELLTRRRFLLGAAALGAAGLFPVPSARTATAAPLAERPRTAMAAAGEMPLRHLVLVMQENRSFDHYFGRFPGADGLPAGAAVQHAGSSCLADPPHDERAMHALASGARSSLPDARTYYTQAELGFYWALARRFTLCDRYFASVLGPTFPNRLFAIAASAGAYRDNPTHIDSSRLPRPTLVDRLEEAGLGWACYLARRPDAMYNPVTYYPERQDDPRASRLLADFWADAAAGRLPAVSWVVTQDPVTEHPPAPPQWGQRVVALIVHALATGPLWGRSALVLHYDEAGGFYDHVPPPRVDGAGFGFRVPCVIVSPYARAGHVSHVTRDHASVLALVERTFGLEPLNARDAGADPFSDCFEFDRPTWAPIAYPASLEGARCAGAPPHWAAELLARPLPGGTRQEGPQAQAIAAGAGGAALAAAGAGALAWHRARRSDRGR